MLKRHSKTFLKKKALTIILTISLVILNLLFIDCNAVLAQVSGKVVSCGCYCGKTTPPPCSDEACKRVCKWKDSSSKGSAYNTSPAGVASEIIRQQREQERQRAIQENQQELQSLELLNETSRQRIGTEEEMRQNAAKRARQQDDQNRKEAISNLKGLPQTDSIDTGELKLKQGTNFFGIPGNPQTDTTNLQLKPVDVNSVDKKFKTTDSKLQVGLDKEAWLEFQKNLLKSRRESDAKFQKLTADLKKIKIPSPVVTRRAVDEGVILGLCTSQTDADKLLKEEKSPFINEKYSDMHKKGRALALSFGTTGATCLEELAKRGIRDHLTLDYTLSQEHIKNVLPALKGTHFKRLIAHSNGATVTEAMIIQGIITVDELNIVGGDRTLVNKQSLQDLLKSGKVKKVNIWVNTGDIIPNIPGTPFPLSYEKFLAAIDNWFEKEKENNDGINRYLHGCSKKRIDIKCHYLRESYYPFIREKVLQEKAEHITH